MTTHKDTILKLKNNTNAGKWIIHNYDSLVQKCKYCGDGEQGIIIEGQCFVCWRNRNPGSME